MYLSIFSLWPVLHILLNNIINKSTTSIIDKIEHLRHPDSITYVKDYRKVNRNIISAIHSVGCSLGCILTLFTESQLIMGFTILYSISYFIWDSYYIVVNDNADDFPFLFHHMVSIYMLKLILDGYLRYYLLLFIIIGEVSNFPYYVVYHKLKTLSNDKDDVKLWRHIQICWFVFLRFIVFGYYAFEFPYVVDNYLLLVLSYMMYFLGIYWGVGQVRGIYKDYYVKDKPA